MPLPTTIIPARPRVRRRRGRLGAPPAFETIITRVTLEDASTVIWHFSSTYSGDSACLALTVNDGGGGGWVSPDSVDAPDEMSIRGFYSGVSLNLSSAWRVGVAIEGLTFAGGPLAVPAGGGVAG